MTDPNADIVDGLHRLTPKPPLSITEMYMECELKTSDTRDYLTPADDLFVLAHMGVPQVDVSQWRLDIVGLVTEPLSLSFDDMQRYPKRAIQTIHQCAGNPFDPTVPTRIVANVEWGGVDVRDLLADVGVQASASHLWAYGLDFGTFAGVEQQHYVKDMPLARIAEGDVLVAYELNGQPLSEKHGFPARLIIPGFYGNNCVKWLCRLELANRRAQSLYTTRFYNDVDPATQARKPVWEIAPESIIVQPAADATLPVAETEIWGWAWSAVDVDVVEVSTDGGHSWAKAGLEPRQQRSWQRFALPWTPPEAGAYTLCCRTTDVDGKTQPVQSARNAIHSVPVTVTEH